MKRQVAIIFSNFNILQIIVDQNHIFISEPLADLIHAFRHLLEPFSTILQMYLLSIRIARFYAVRVNKFSRVTFNDYFLN